MSARKLPYLTTAAAISDCGLYRYTLWRGWSDELPVCNFVMLNPSTANETEDDPTIRRCVGFARRWSYGGIVVTNLFALRSRHPELLRRAVDPVGPENDEYIENNASNSDRVIVAWGNHGDLMSRGRAVLELLRPYKPRCFSLTSNGQPVHPLYQRADAEPFTIQPESAQ